MHAKQVFKIMIQHCLHFIVWALKKFYVCFILAFRSLKPDASLNSSKSYSEVRASCHEIVLPFAVFSSEK